VQLSGRRERERNQTTELEKIQIRNQRRMNGKIEGKIRIEEDG
jgi:hypothetical protein